MHGMSEEFFIVPLLITSPTQIRADLQFPITSSFVKFCIKIHPSADWRKSVTRLKLTGTGRPNYNSFGKTCQSQ